MEAGATFGGTQIATGVLRTFIVLLFAALLVGGLGGYMVRALTSSPTTTVTETHRPFVVEQAPYSSATPLPTVLKGYPVPH